MGNLSSKSGNPKMTLDESAFVHNDWNIFCGKLDGNSVTVFSSRLPVSSRKRPFIDQAVKFSRVYRHPSLLKYIDIKMNQDEVNIVTERAIPLQEYEVTTLSPLEIIAGLLSILEGLIFLHDKAGASHNNVCPSSIYITSDNSWKLWGFEYMCSFAQLTKDHIEKIDQYCCQKFIPPDQKSTVSPEYQHARDSYAFAQLIIDLVNEEISTEIIGCDLLMTFLTNECLIKDWTKRPRLKVLLLQTAFQHEFLQIKQNVSNILLLSVEEKENFTRTLPSKLKEYPEELVAATLMSSLLTRPIIDIPAAQTQLMPFILIPNVENSGGYFSPAIYKKFVVPLIVKLFSLHDLTIRMTLLKYFYHYVEIIPKDFLAKEILPQLLLGIRDSDEGLVASTLIDLAYLIPILGADVVVGSNRDTIFSASQPKKENKTKKLSTEDIPPPAKTINVVTQNSERTSVQETRSSPDGGEREEGGKIMVSCRGDWSDWEELMDDQPDIVGSLKVMTSDTEDVFEKYPEMYNHNLTSDRISSASSTKSDLPIKCRSDSTSSTNTSSAMQIKQKCVQEKKNTINNNDMMTIKVEKKPQPDLFEDLKPKIKSSSFNLERMLIEANTRSVSHTSVATRLTEIQFTDVSGNEWQEEPNWSFDEDNT